MQRRHSLHRPSEPRDDQDPGSDDENSDSSDDPPMIESLLQLLSGRRGSRGRTANDRPTAGIAAPRLSAEFAGSRLRHSVRQLLLDDEQQPAPAASAAAACALSGAKAAVMGTDSSCGGAGCSPTDEAAVAKSSCFPFGCASASASTATPPAAANSSPAPAVRRRMSVTAVVSESARAGCFGARQRYHLAHSRLPNASRVMLTGRSYFFCGLFSEPGDVFMCAAQGDNSPIRIYDTRDGRFDLIKSVLARDVGWSVLDLSLSPTGHHMLYSSWSHCLQLVGVHSDMHQALSLVSQQGDPQEFADNYSRGLFCHRWSSCGDLVIVGCNGGSLCLYDMALGRARWFRARHDNDVNTVCWADGGRSSTLLLSSGDDGLVKLWDLRTMRAAGTAETGAKPEATFSGHQCGVVFLDSRQDGRHFLTNSKDQTIKLWDMRRPAGADMVAKCRMVVARRHFDYRYQGVPRFDPTPMAGDPSLATLTGHVVSRTLLRARFSPPATTGQRYVYAGSANGSLLIWDGLTGRVAHRLDGLHPNTPVRDVSWHPYDSQRLMSAGWDARVRCSYFRPGGDMFD